MLFNNSSIEGLKELLKTLPFAGVKEIKARANELLDAADARLDELEESGS